MARILGAVGRPPYLCVWSGHLAAGRFLCTAPEPVAVSVFCVCLGSLWGVFCVLLWAVPGTAGAWRRGAYSVRGFGFILFVMRWIIPLCLILIAFFPPFLARVETSAQKPLICEYNAYGVGLMVGVRGP